MRVRELLDKQLEWTPIVIGEEYDCRGCAWANKIKPYINELKYREDVYDKYGDREVEYFDHFLDPDNRIVMSIQLVKNT